MTAGSRRRLRMFGTLLRTYGPRGLARRAGHEIRRSSGRFKARPAARPIDAEVPAPPLYRPSGNWLDAPREHRQTIIERGNRVAAGRYQAFGDAWRQLPRSSREWRVHPSTGFEFVLAPWWTVPHMPAGSDIKDIWEPARFAWVYDLIRAYSVTGDRRYADPFYEHLAAWCEANPPFLGPHWACGQEVSIRALAILHGLQSLPPPRRPVSPAEPLAGVLAWSGERIADAIGYGLSQRNNHGISESAGLIHLGSYLDGAHPEAAHWRRRGKHLIEEQIRDQFSADGWYAQHSFNYMRVALEQALYAEHVMNSTGAGLSAAALSRLDAAISLLASVVDASTGKVPNHGANDGARVLPLSASAYRDFRPVLTLAALVRRSPLPADIPADDDTRRWFDIALPAPAAARSAGVRCGSSGWVSVRTAACTIFVFAGKYRHRPSHLDSLHVDVSIDGREVVTDPGTFSYNAPAPWGNGLAAASVHNGPLLDGAEPAERGPRFLWLTWPSARVVSAEYQEGVARVVAERPGAVRREISVCERTVRVIDRALDHSAHSLQVTWLLHPDALDDYVVDADGARSVGARDDSLVGWYSPTYGVRRASRAVRVVRRVGSDPAIVDTVIKAKSGV